MDEKSRGSRGRLSPAESRLRPACWTRAEPAGNRPSSPQRKPELVAAGFPYVRKSAPGGCCNASRQQAAAPTGWRKEIIDMTMYTSSPCSAMVQRCFAGCLPETETTPRRRPLIGVAATLPEWGCGTNSPDDRATESCSTSSKTP